MSAQLNEPTEEEKQQCVDDIVTKAKKGGWWFVVASDPYEKDEYIGPVDEETAKEIVNNAELYTYRKTKHMRKLTKPKYEHVNRKDGVILAIAFIGDEDAFGPFSSKYDACVKVARGDWVVTPALEIEKCALETLWFSAHNFLRARRGHLETK